MRFSNAMSVLRPRGRRQQKNGWIRWLHSSKARPFLVSTPVSYCGRNSQLAIPRKATFSPWSFPADLLIKAIRAGEQRIKYVIQFEDLLEWGR